MKNSNGIKDLIQTIDKNLEAARASLEMLAKFYKVNITGDSEKGARSHFGNDDYYNIYELSKVVMLARSSIYRKIENGTFPAPVKLSERRVAWCKKTIEAYLKDKRTTNES